MFKDVLKHRSGRVIALARLALAAVFLLAVWVDPTQPPHAPTATYATLAGYLLFAIALVAFTWDSWWHEAKLAAPSHAVDILMFPLLVFLSDGYTSPFFVFFVFLLVSAAIRWGWRGTAITAAAVTLFYFGAGLIAGDGSVHEFELQRIIIRSGNLLTLSALLIWFGVNHDFGAFRVTKYDLLRDLSPQNSPLETAVEGAARVSGAKVALLVWSEEGRKDGVAVSLQDTQTSTLPIAEPVPDTVPQRPFLFDLARSRALTRGPHRRMQFSRPENMLDAATARRLGIAKGLAIPVRTDAGQGLLQLGGIKSLCTDHLDFAAMLGSAVADHIQRHALLAAVEESATAKARLAFARDLHDSIVQFLAGATFRVEAIRRSLRADEKADRELKDLKELLLQEQQELRSAIGAFQSEKIALPTLADDLRALCDRLARQWNIDCTFSAEVDEAQVPMRFHLDTHQLVREAVANAVRHARAKRVTVELLVDDLDLRLDITNDGSAIVRLKEGSPRSLRERIDEANGTLVLASGETNTHVSITLPLDRKART